MAFNIEIIYAGLLLLCMDGKCGGGTPGETDVLLVATEEPAIAGSRGFLTCGSPNSHCHSMDCHATKAHNPRLIFPVSMLSERCTSGSLTCLPYQTIVDRFDSVTICLNDWRTFAD